MKLRTLFLSAAIAGVSLSAATAHAAASPASTYELTPGTLTPGVVSTSPTLTFGSGTTVDDFTFSLDNPYTTMVTGFYFNYPGSDFAISSADLTLYSGTPSAAGSSIATTGVFTPSTGTPTLGASLGSGDYFVQSSVVVPSGDTGAFSIGATVSAAPEPSTWALMIVGVGFAGAALRFGRNRTAAFA